MSAKTQHARRRKLELAVNKLSASLMDCRDNPKLIALVDYNALDTLLEFYYDAVELSYSAQDVLAHVNEVLEIVGSE